MYNDLPAGQLDLCQMWSGDVVNAQYYLPKGGPPTCWRYWFPPDGKGMVDNDLMVILEPGQEPGARAPVRQLHAGHEERAEELRLHRLPAAADVARRREQTVSDGYVPANLATAVVRKEWFGAGYRLLELPPVADAAWHQVWQRFKAGA